MITTKRCTGCGKSKPTSSFNRRPASADGLSYRCKPCVAADNRSWLDRNRERELAKSRARKRGTGRTRLEQERTAHPERLAARWALNNAVRDGRITKPKRCEGCGRLTASRRLHGHHTDYAKKLEVEWLCKDCHESRHHPEEVYLAPE